MDTIETLNDIIKRKMAAGETSACLSEANMAVLGRTPMPPQSQLSPLPSPQPSQQPQYVPPPMAAPPMAAPPMAAPPPTTAAADAYPPPPDVASADWEALTAACLACRSCGLCRRRLNVVVEDGSRQAELMFIGEGPGEEEDIQGVPFVGRAGQLLTKMIAAMKRRRDKDAPRESAVYIANIVKCRPPGNRNPEPPEAQACLGYLKRQIELVRPRAIVLLGAVPLLGLMGLTGITRRRGEWLDYNGIPVMPTFHPAYLLRFERFPAQFVQNKRLVWQDLQMVMERLKN